MVEALITGIVAIVVCIINSWVQMARTREETNKTIALVEYKITQLSDQVARHNQILDRTYKLEESSALQDAEIKRINRRLEIVEGGKA